MILKIIINITDNFFFVIILHEKVLSSVFLSLEFGYLENKVILIS